MNPTPADATAEDCPSQEDAFFTAFRVFHMSLEFAALPAPEQCRVMGNFNVAWELQADLLAGSYLLGCGRLSAEHEESVKAVLSAVEPVPVRSLPAGAGLEPNLVAMQHPSWAPVRIAASTALRALAPFATENAKYMHPPPYAT